MTPEHLLRVIFEEPITCTPERRAQLLALAQADGQPWTEDQDASGWTDHMAEIMYGDDLPRVTPPAPAR